MKSSSDVFLWAETGRKHKCCSLGSTITLIVIFNIQFSHRFCVIDFFKNGNKHKSIFLPSPLLKVSVSGEFWAQITQRVVICNSRQALLTASTLRQCRIGGVSAQDQMMSRFILLQLEAVSGYGNPAQSRKVLFLLSLLPIVALLSSLWDLHVLASMHPAACGTGDACL